MVYDALGRLRHEHLALQARNKGAAWRAFSDVVGAGLLQYAAAR
jgi:hypothetical protein